MVRKLKIANEVYIPLEIQEEILKKLPVKSLIRFISVSKPWKSLIQSSKFIVDYRVQKHRLLVVSSDPKDITYNETKYVSIVDDDTFPQQKLELPLPMSLNGQPPKLIGSSHGLLCFSCKNLVVIWNPTIRKSVSIDVPDLIILPYETMYGFGVCPVTYDIKLVKMIFSCKLGESYTVEVFTLSSGFWRSPHGNLPRKSIRTRHCQSQLYIDGYIYWAAYDNIRLPSGYYRRSRLIISFSTTGEEFTEISYPNSLALKGKRVGITKLRESLAVAGIDLTDLVYSIWMLMNPGDPKSFTKIYNINLEDASLQNIFAFKPSGEAIVKLNEDVNDDLFVYEPNSKQISFVISHSYYLCCYTETLLLLDH